MDGSEKMAASQYISLKKLVGKNFPLNAAKHNLREIQAEIGADKHIDASRIRQNRILAGPSSAAEVAASAESMLKAAGISSLRRDAVRSVELVISLPAWASVVQSTYFEDVLDWVCRFFAVPVLSAVIHLDEAAPHCHVLLLPLVNGRMVGSDLVGNRSRLRAIRDDFFANVASKHGLTPPSASAHSSADSRKQAASLILDTIEAQPELLSNLAIKEAMREVLKRNPEPVLVAMGIRPDSLSAGTSRFVSIMTKPCSPENTVRPKQGRNPIGFAPPAAIEKPRTLSCVGFDGSDATGIDGSPGQRNAAFQSREAPDHAVSALDAPAAHLVQETSPEFARCRDDQPSEYWDSELGEFRSPPQPEKKRTREAAAEEVKHLLAARGAGATLQGPIVSFCTADQKWHKTPQETTCHVD
ncbi:MAG: hypothetical protein H6R10_1462 [Rhodocyclaceae bacterium]|nr:hypothetical protein [Rhodocyclaceae bacterium]